MYKKLIQYIFALIFLSLAGIISMDYFILPSYVGYNNEHYLPDIRGRHVQQAKYELVSLGFYNRKISKINKDKIIEKLIHDCGIDSIKNQIFENISSGEKQRTWIAFILAQSKNIILMDEPFSSIDTNSKTEFYKLFKNLADKGNTIILISHDIKIISEFSEQAIFIQNGVKIFDGDAKEIQLAIKNSEII